MNDPVPRLQRILNLIPMLRSRPGMSVRELCEELGASRKEVLGDLNRIFLVGVPPYLPHDYILVHNDDDHISIDFADHFARPVRLTLREALALKLAIESLPVLSGEMSEAATALLGAVNSLLRKSNCGLDEELLEERGARIGVTASTALSERLSELQNLIEAGREIKLAYYSASSDAVSERWLRPYALVDQGGNFYLLAYCLKSEDLRSFRVDRIERVVDRQGPPFELPDNLDELWDRRIGPSEESGLRVRARFHPSIARWVREDYGEELVEEEEDGSLIVEFTTGSVPWAVQKLLGYGELVTVLSPDSVRQQLLGRLSSLVNES